MTKTLHELRTIGFNKLRPGRIHLRCPCCGHKMSNVKRGKHDPTSAFLVEVPCDKCGAGDKDCSADYFDADGKPVYLCDYCLERDATMDDHWCDKCRAYFADEEDEAA